MKLSLSHFEKNTRIRFELFLNLLGDCSINLQQKINITERNV